MWALQEDCFLKARSLGSDLTQEGCCSFLQFRKWKSALHVSPLSPNLSPNMDFCCCCWSSDRMMSGNTSTCSFSINITCVSYLEDVLHHDFLMKFIVGSVRHYTYNMLSLTLDLNMPKHVVTFTSPHVALDESELRRWSCWWHTLLTKEGGVETYNL